MSDIFAKVTKFCHVCGKPAEIDPRSCIGDCCAPARNHVVSNRTDRGDALAVCPCGWTDRQPWSSEGLAAREMAVIAHWRDVVAREAL